MIYYFWNGNQIQRLRIEEQNKINYKKIQNIKDIYSIYSVPKGNYQKENKFIKLETRVEDT